MTDEYAAFVTARLALAAELVDHAARPPDTELASVVAAAEAITGPFLFGDFDHLKDTDPDGYTAERLKALAADERKLAAQRGHAERLATLTRLEAEYTTAAIRLAEAVVAAEGRSGGRCGRESMITPVTGSRYRERSSGRVCVVESQSADNHPWCRWVDTGESFTCDLYDWVMWNRWELVS